MTEPIREREFYTVRILRDVKSRVAITEHWSKKDGGTHREDGPAEIVRDARTGTIKSETWWRNNMVDREDGPAIIERDPKTGIVTDERWIQKNRYHREDGPAIIKRKADTGKVYFTQWFVNDVKVSPRCPRPGAPRRPGGTASPSNT